MSVWAQALQSEVLALASVDGTKLLGAVVDIFDMSVFCFCCLVTNTQQERGG